MAISASPWWLFACLAAGLGLAYFLYWRDRERLAPGRRKVLAVLTGVAWLALGVLALRPLRVETRVEFHPPTVVLAVDVSPSYAAGASPALEAGNAVRLGTEELRRRYQSQGFRVLDFDFAERVVPSGRGGDPGRLTGLRPLREYLDSMAIPNLQAVFLFTDGRFNLDGGNGGTAWPAPVFPVLLRGMPGAEAQGESATLDLETDSGAEGLVEWRPTGSRTGAALLELRAGTKTLWRERLPLPQGALGERLSHRFRLSRGVAREAAAAGSLAAWVRPEREAENRVAANDTLAVARRGNRRSRQVFVRPLQSLEERGLLDALFASESLEVSVVVPDSTQGLGEEDALWIRSGSSSRARALESARGMGAPIVFYGGRGSHRFTGEARVSYAEDAGGILPAGVLRLADLGTDSLDLETADSAVEVIAWVEERGKRGILLGRRLEANLGRTFVIASLPLWSTGFRPDAEERILTLQRLWMRGAVEMIRRRGRGVWVEKPASLIAGRPFYLAATLPSETGRDKPQAPRLECLGKSFPAVPSGGEIRFGPIELPSGAHAAVLFAGSTALWKDTLIARDPLAAEMSLLGADVEGLASLAEATSGKTPILESDSSGRAVFISGLPDLPRGQMQDKRTRTRPLLPQFWLAMLASGLFCVVWALRKKFRLD